MRVSESWLRELVAPSLGREELVAQLTMAGLEVEAVELAAPSFSGVRIGDPLEGLEEPRCTANGSRSGNVFSPGRYGGAGQPSLESLPQLKEKGYSTIINLRTEQEDRPAGDTLGAILGLGYDDDTDPDQLARLGTALHLSQRHINNMWIPASGWGYQA